MHIATLAKTLAAVAAVLLLAGAAARADTIDLGYVSNDVTSAGVSQFDITNITGPNQAALGSPAFPVTNTVDFSNLQLIVSFSNDTSQTYGDSFFTASLDGISFNGPTVPFGGTNPTIVSAMLTGDFSTATFDLANGSTFLASAELFSAAISDPLGALQDGDAALISASSSGANVPEPASLPLLLVPLAVFAMLRSRLLLRAGTLLLAGSATLANATTVPVGLSTATSPSNGAAGFSSVYLTTYNLPKTAPAAIAVVVAPTCAAGASGKVSGEIDTVATAVTNLPGGAGERVKFLIPAATPTGTFFVSIKGTGSGGSPFASKTCALVAVSNSVGALDCLPTSSLAVAFGNSVVAYVPNGAWITGSRGVQAVTIEGSGAPVSIATPDLVNSCAANPATAETICTANNTDIYLLANKALSATVTSGATAYTSYSGGQCLNCGVSVNPLTNTAYIAEGSNSAPAGSGTQLQVLDLSGNTLQTPFPTQFQLSEDVAIDPGRNLVLSPSYGPGFNTPSYQLYTLNSAGTVTAEYAYAAYGGPGSALPDSAAEDCSTGIALSSDEDRTAVFLADLTQASFGTATWSSASQVQQLLNTTGFSAGVTGIAVAPGSTHLGVISGEFGGNTFGAIKLPATSGSGTPSLVDYVSASLPATPDGYGFSAGYDPHTVTAYTSPKNGKAYAIIADWALGSPSYVAVIDLAAALAAPRSPGTAIIDPSVDLLTTGIVRYVAAR